MLKKWFQKPWLLIVTMKGKTEVVTEHWLKWGANRHMNSLASMKPLTSDRVPIYQVMHRSEWDAR
jgi:hypothetical protein